MNGNSIEPDRVNRLTGKEAMVMAFARTQIVDFMNKNPPQDNMTITEAFVSAWYNLMGCPLYKALIVPDLTNKNGKPDFIMLDKKTREIKYIEVKSLNSGLSLNQLQWIMSNSNKTISIIFVSNNIAKDLGIKKRKGWYHD